MSGVTEYTPEMADTICKLIAEGNSLITICKRDDMPGYSTVMKWLAKPDNSSFVDNYLRAREAQADAIFDECLDIADDDKCDIGTKEDGTPFIKMDNVQRARLRIDTRMRMAGKLKPKKYGDSTQLKHADADGNKLSIGSILSSINGNTAGLPADDELPE